MLTYKMSLSLETCTVYLLVSIKIFSLCFATLHQIFICFLLTVFFPLPMHMYAQVPSLLLSSYNLQLRVSQLFVAVLLPHCAEKAG